jgi:adenosylcobyric acid synthase
MLGRAISDPAGLESGQERETGLGLLPVQTMLTPEKRTRAVTATTCGGVQFGGYEIHLGITTCDPPGAVAPFARVSDGSADGAQMDGVIGTYLHGAFEHPAVCAEVFGVDVPAVTSKAEDYRRLGAWFEEHGRHLGELGFD